VLVLISEVWGGFSLEAMRLLGELAQARNDGVDLERASATWSTSSFTSYHGQLLSLAVQWGVAIEIERAIKKSARLCPRRQIVPKFGMRTGVYIWARPRAKQRGGGGNKKKRGFPAWQTHALVNLPHSSTAAS
jgi:hypothetical protein